MGVSTDGQLSYGYVFDEGFEFPWDKGKYDGDVEVWWEEVRGFTGTVDYPFDEFGEYKEGVESNSPEVSSYFSERREWHVANPFPVELVNYCSGECPMYILASKHVRANRGYPREIAIDSLQVTTEDRQRLLNFVEEFGIVPEGELGWWLSSYWG